MKHTPLHILISPLDWGLGHASRCVQIIRILLDKGHKVSIAGGGRSLEMLKAEFPHLDFYHLPSFSPKYASNRFLVLTLLFQLPAFFKEFILENIRLKRLLKVQDFDIIISDNRYGFRSAKKKCILITHQLMLKMPRGFGWAEWPVHLLVNILLKPFNSIWIPDFKERFTLSGDLSHKYAIPSNAFFVGPLSRFENNGNLAVEKTIDVLVILSGAEPQRSILENSILNQLVDLPYKSVIIAGKSESHSKAVVGNNIEIISFLASNELLELINQSKVVVCRSGYSSIMDLSILGAKVILIPTPGQTEQEYLASKLTRTFHVVSCHQDELNLRVHIPLALKGGRMPNVEKNEFIKTIIEQTIENAESR